jgi:hypothetical protein
LGKKKIRKKYSSSGSRKNVSNKHNFNMHSVLDRAIFKAEAKAKGKRVCETIPNPDKSNTKERFIRVCTNG